jgi:hypothetical protein
MTQVIQPVKILGAGLAALVSSFLNRDGQDIALGRYLLTQGESQNINSLVSLDLFYSKEKIEEIAKDPVRGYTPST